ncbi:hypothetical protein Tco_0484954 [Tanacetum coccineum]
MILNLVQNGPLIWPTVTEEDVTIRTKKYEELFATEKIQADCDCKATKIVLQGLPPDVYAIVNHHKVAKEIWDRVKLLICIRNEICLVVPVFNPGDDPIACLNKAMAFLIDVASSRLPSTNNQLRTSSNSRNQATIQDSMVTVQQVQGRQGQSYPVVLVLMGIATSTDGQAAQTTIPNTTAFETEDFDAYDSDCDDVSNAKAVLKANLFNYSSDVILEHLEGIWRNNHNDLALYGEEKSQDYGP